MATEDLPTTDAGPDASVEYLDYEGTPLAYIDQGTGPVTVVAVPGLPGSTRDFRWLAPELTPRLRVIRVDLPGYGHSPRPRFDGMTTGQRAEPVRALITALDLAPVVLLGHSAGGTVVAHLSRHHPALVRCCVLLAPPGPTPHYSQRLMRAAAPALHLPGARMLLYPIARRAFAAAGFPSYLTDDERAHTVLDDAVCDFAEHAENLAHIQKTHAEELGQWPAAHLSLWCPISASDFAAGWGGRHGTGWRLGRSHVGTSDQGRAAQTTRVNGPTAPGVGR